MMWMPIALLVFSCITSVAGAACKPSTIIMTRASGSPASVKDNGHYLPKYPLNGANLANVNGALKFIMSETIDFDTGVTNHTVTNDDGTTTNKCFRKNKVNFIHFYKVTFCNSNAALAFFNPGGSANSDTKEFGAYLTYDSGQCHDSVYCKMIHGVDENPRLLPWVGFQQQALDPRAPTRDAYWYSIPGKCPLKQWGKKTDDCNKKHHHYQCKDGQIPDGVTCTWQYEFLGQVVLDDLVGITSKENPANPGSTFANYEEFCLAGGVEFRRDQDNKFTDGLDFWKLPTSMVENKRRVDKLVELYKNKEKYPRNKPWVQPDQGVPCYQAVRQCGDGVVTGTRTCVRDDSGVCVYCIDSNATCPSVPSNWKESRFPKLDEKVEIKKLMGSDGGNGTDSGGSSSSEGKRNMVAWSTVFTTTLFVALM